MGEEPEVVADSEEVKVVSFSKRIKWSFVILTAIFFLILLAFTWVVTDIRQLSEENEHRISEIQESRTSSCKQTYEGIREVFRPFFPPEPRTKEQQEDLDLFNETIDGFVQGCTEQTDPNNGGSNGKSG